MTHQGSSRPHSGIALPVGQLLADALEAGDLAAQGFAAESTDALEVIPAVTGGESSFQGLTEVTPVVGALFLRNYEIKGPTDRLACAVTEDVLGGLARK